MNLEKQVEKYIESRWSEALNIWADNYSLGDAHQTLLLNVQNGEIIFEYTTNRINNVYPWIELLHAQGNHEEFSVRDYYGNSHEKEIADDLMLTEIISKDDYDKIIQEIDENPFQHIDEIRALHRLWKNAGVLEDLYPIDLYNLCDEVRETQEKLDFVVNFMEEKGFDLDSLQLSKSGYYLMYDTIFTIENAYRWAKECLSYDADIPLICSLMGDYETEESEVESFHFA